MPSRRKLPTLSIFSRKSSSTTPTPSAPTSSPSPDTRTTPNPLTPPARLHLRHILPSTPDGVPTPPPPPRQPFPWLWQCHSCDTVYRLGCTRRCLVCSHDYCLSATPPKTSRGKKRRRSAMCVSEFDYNGWAEWGAWRRKVLGMEKHHEQDFLKETHNCMTDCNYPSECHHVRYRMRTEAFKRRLLDALPEEPQSSPIVASVPINPDDDLPLNEARVILEDEDKGNKQKSPTSPKSPLSKTFFPSDEPERKEGKVWWTEEANTSTNTNLEREIRKPKDAELEGPGKGKSSSSGAEEFDSEALSIALAEDQNMMPLDLLDYIMSTRDESRQSEQEHPRHSSESNAQKPTDADRSDDQEESTTDSDSDSGSASSSRSSSSSVDGQWLLASTFVPPSQGGGSGGKAQENKK
ncbi:uncharacterized protein F4812DRAFT_199782 [Daldinia caldariorum]|uniref:uncharacterized protein n=1 Tax=Daldinia caldariorum TaxID=326644 RepID=UPI002008BB28|nr:uncharacterized protein F4812DRAFT_199782 [Daldinia caldariorum]KAI1471938.1 hypothetical protein F4812DRAFT_199782 [Daldinia caldariorum]